MKRFYIGYGSALLLILSGFHLFGWSFASVNNVKVENPKSVRDNPGAYRTHYSGGK